ncbi:Zinc resistance conferring protein [Elasticomyces elasticus]|uniref:Zinc resistance conferring protein n=1 Tax=Exophiala sideris TaxID=1016849 RepID=A0ABR0JQ63_9EURO|nr:Zinc resistance conferring protein [Elasticomyces elasticus]KAK5039720.1 Zinc resistance conferring protein [Exophiala sideris]KAK5041272.1 Zinc resistance conferring protein [Exophiala sideris]KAK5068098.1 Zinc resistance conferring protein [Exophiala sideris]KAK5187399.1 Zinc resistance conferring protein [Eurotiomycetes sp. CCFEE 6388]
MGLSKSQKLVVLLVIDALFFLIELVTGYAVHSLALVADSFHMLNDVLSLCVGLWAVRVADAEKSKMFTYGWQRAEILGALVNGVFLVALCMSIFLEAIQRFVQPQVVSNPKVVLLVGCLGLASNILGLFLFHDHGHGSHDHGHHHGDVVKSAEEGHNHEHTHSNTEPRGARIDNDATPKSGVVGQTATTAAKQQNRLSGRSFRSAKRRSLVADGGFNDKRRSLGSIEGLLIHPASFRQEIIQAAQLDSHAENEDDDASATFDKRSSQFTEDSPLLPNFDEQPPSHGFAGTKRLSGLFSHSTHHHTQPKDTSKDHSHSGHSHGHSHGDLNLRGVFLHVLGDALGNIGVIGSALIIWLTHFDGRYYFDPGISLVITVIILCSAIPLCKAAGRILLQAVPMGISIDEITLDIESLPCVIEAHDLHVWQLSDAKIVASLHVKVDNSVQESSTTTYMTLAGEIRNCLLGYGIHSTTIQPEFITLDDLKTTTDISGKQTTVRGGANGKKKSQGGAVAKGCLLE